MSHASGTLLIAIATRTAVMALFLIAGFRLLGKRQLGQVNIYDLAMIMALANGIQNAMTGGKGYLAVGMVSAGTLILIGKGFSLLFIRVPAAEARIVGTPTVIINNGEILRDPMRREHVTEDQVMATLRSHGLSRLEQVRMAILEVDGSLSIVPREGPGEP